MLFAVPSYLGLLLLIPICFVCSLFRVALEYVFYLFRWWDSRKAAFALLALSPAIADGRAFDELNAQRANYGLPPMVEVAELTEFAQMKAEYQAARGIRGFHLGMRPTGMTGHEGPMYPGPAGTWVEGTGHFEAGGPWMTCATRTLGANLQAGAGVAIGPDGHRYMVLIVLGRNLQSDNRRGIPMINTAHLTPDAPRVGGAGFSAPRSPGVSIRAPFVRVDVGGRLPAICPRCGRRHL